MAAADVATLFDGGAPGAGRRPAVVYVHGGPPRQMLLGWHYSDYYTNAYAMNQYLASRGYVVLDPDYRASAGYGRDWRTAIYRWMGGHDLNDVVDGAGFLVKTQKVNAKRIGVYGGSYGGYAALMGSILTPELYRCAISWAGGTDLDEMMQQDKMQLLPTRYRRWHARVHGADKQDLDDVSPVKLAERVAIPVLVMHGTEDDNVPIRQGRIFNKAAQKAGRPVEYIEFEGAGHQIETTADRIKFLTAVEAFLAKHNPAGGAK